MRVKCWEEETRERERERERNRERRMIFIAGSSAWNIFGIGGVRFCRCLLVLIALINSVGEW